MEIHAPMRIGAAHHAYPNSNSPEAKPPTISTKPLAMKSMLIDSGGPVIPNYAAQSSSCVVHNHLFCTDWLRSNWGTVLWPALRSHLLLCLAAIAIGFVISLGLALLAHHLAEEGRQRPAER